MRKSRPSRHQQNRLNEHFVAGTTPHTVACLCGVHRNISAYYFHRLREIIVFKIEPEAKEVFGGKTEVDEC